MPLRLLRSAEVAEWTLIRDFAQWKSAILRCLEHGEVLNRELRLRKKDGIPFWTSASARLMRAPDGTPQLFDGTLEDITERKQAEEEVRKAKEDAERLNEQLRVAVARAGELKFEAGKLDIETIDFGLHDTLDRMNDLLAVKAQEKGLEYVCRVDPAVPTLLQGDPGRLRQIITNLIGNAIKFTAEGEVLIGVSLLADSEKSARVRFEVSDTGVGIPPERVGALFQAFMQADASTTRKYGGTGLGLAISKRLCEIMSGRIGVDSQLGKGSTFWFELPFTKRPERPAPPAGAAQAPEAALRDDPFEVAILDMQMPVVDGEQLGRTIKSDESLQSVRLIMMTSIGSRGDAARMGEIGFSAYLAKPVKKLVLRDCILSVLNDVPLVRAPEAVR